MAGPAKSTQRPKTKQRRAGGSLGSRKTVRVERPAGQPSLQELAEDFAKHRVRDKKKLTPFQRRMMSGGA